jgi:hypothetical protein
LADVRWKNFKSARSPPPPTFVFGEAHAMLLGGQHHSKYGGPPPLAELCENREDVSRCDINHADSTRFLRK